MSGLGLCEGKLNSLAPIAPMLSSTGIGATTQNNATSK